MSNRNWIRSSFCHWDQPQCVEVRVVTGGRWRGSTVEMRDSKLGSASPVERFSARRWRRFLSELDLHVPAYDGYYRVGDLAYTPEEWAAFKAGVDAGEFAVDAMAAGH